METFIPKGQLYGPVMPKSLLQQKNISLGAKLLYGVLCSCAYKSGDHCWPSQGFLADSIGVSIRSIQNYLGELQTLGLIFVKRGRFGSSLKYYFLKSSLVTAIEGSSAEEKPDDSKEKTACAHAKVAQGYAKPAYIENINNKYKNITPPSPSRVMPSVPLPAHSGGGGFSSAMKSAEEGFAKVWDCWPRKESRAAALRVWKHLWFSGKLLPVPLMLEKTEAFKKHDSSWQRGYVPYLVNWLRAERWLESPQETAPQAVITSQTVTANPVDELEAQRLLEDFTRRARENSYRMLLESKNPRITALIASKHGGSNAEEQYRKTGTS